MNQLGTFVGTIFFAAILWVVLTIPVPLTITWQGIAVLAALGLGACFGTLVRKR